MLVCVGPSCVISLLLMLLLHPLNGLFSRTTWVSQQQEGKTSLDLNEARDDGVWGWQWNQLDQFLQARRPTNSVKASEGNYIM